MMGDTKNLDLHDLNTQNYEKQANPGNVFKHIIVENRLWELETSGMWESLSHGSYYL